MRSKEHLRRLCGPIVRHLHEQLFNELRFLSRYAGDRIKPVHEARRLGAPTDDRNFFVWSAILA